MMGNLLFSLIFLAGFFVSTNGSVSKEVIKEGNSIVGTWEGVADGEVGLFIFDAEGFVTIDQGGEVMGGKSFEMDGELFSMTYKLNDLGDYMEISFYVTHKLTEISMRSMHGILRFISKDKMDLCLDFGEEDTDLSFDNDDCILFSKR